MEQPKPCPFCGNTYIKVSGKLKAKSNYHNAEWNYSARCTKCKARGPIKETEYKAIRDWNIPSRGQSGSSEETLFNSKEQ